MQITQEELEKFRELFRQEYGVELSKQDALERALIVLGVMRATYY